MSYDTRGLNMLMNDEDFLKLLEKYEFSYKYGDIVEGCVVDYDGNNILIDINAKTTALCPKTEVLLVNNQKAEEVLLKGEKYSFVINSSQDEDGTFYVSHKKVALINNMKILEEKFENDATLEAAVISLTKGGLIVSVMGVKGFIPSSQMKDTVVKSGEKIPVKILSLDFTQNNFILSNKKVYLSQIEIVKKEILEKIELNMVVKGKVTRLTDFGAFVDIGGLDGLLPLSQISWKWIDNPNDVLKVDDVIDVEIIGIDKEKQRISLSLKSLEENPWLKAQEVIQDKKEIIGTVTRIKPFGVFIEVYPKVEGLLNRAQMQEYIKKHQKNFIEDEKIEVIIKKFDADKQKIILEVK